MGNRLIIQEPKTLSRPNGLSGWALPRRIAASLLFCPLLLALSFASYAQETPVDTFTPAVHTIPAMQAEMMYFDAVKARLKGDDKEAEELLQKVIKMNPGASGAYFDLARLSMKQNRAEKATEYIDKAISLDPGNPWYQSQLAEILILRNKFEEAARIYDKLAKQERHNDEYLYKAAGLYVQTGKHKEALDLLDKIIETGGEDEQILLKKQELYLKMNDLENAVKVSEKLIALNPQDGRYYMLLAEIYDNNKKEDKAIEIYKSASEKFPHDPNVQLALANYYLKKNDTAKYNEYALKAVTNKSLDAQEQIAILIEYIRAHGADTSRRNDILDMTRQISEQHPRNAEVTGIYGDILLLNGKREEGMAQYKKSLEIDPSRFPVWQNLLSQYTAREEADSLLVYAGKALRLFPNQAILHHLKGIAHYHKKEYRESIQSLNRAIDMQPEDDAQRLADIYSMLGEVYNSNKQYSESDEAFQKSLQLDPDNPGTLNNYSYYLSERGKKLEEAEKMSEKSLKMSPNSATFLDTYGWIMYKQGKFEKAKEYIQKAIDTDPANADGTLYDHIGDINYKLKNVDKAVEYWQKAKEKGSDNPFIDKKISEKRLYE